MFRSGILVSLHTEKGIIVKLSFRSIEPRWLASVVIATLLYSHDPAKTLNLLTILMNQQ